MPSFSEKRILPYQATQIYSLVMDIEQYPEFLPWCKQAKIIEVVSDKNLIADLLINFKSIFEKYRSDVKHGANDEGYFVHVNAIEGPFKTLINRWNFKDLPSQDPQIAHQCEVEFFIDFTFNSFLLEKMLGGIFSKATKKMMAAFEDRALVIFRP